MYDLLANELARRLGTKNPRIFFSARKFNEYLPHAKFGETVILHDMESWHKPPQNVLDKYKQRWVAKDLKNVFIPLDRMKEHYIKTSEVKEMEGKGTQYSVWEYCKWRSAGLEQQVPGRPYHYANGPECRRAFLAGKRQGLSDVLNFIGHGSEFEMFTHCVDRTNKLKEFGAPSKPLDLLTVDHAVKEYAKNARELHAGLKPYFHILKDEFEKYKKDLVNQKVKESASPLLKQMLDTYHKEVKGVSSGFEKYTFVCPACGVDSLKIFVVPNPNKSICPTGWLSFKCGQCKHDFSESHPRIFFTDRPGHSFNHAYASIVKMWAEKLIAGRDEDG